METRDESIMSSITFWFDLVNTVLSLIQLVLLLIQLQMI